MKLSDLIRKLEEILAREGDIPTCWESLTHSWPPDPVVRERAGTKVVLLNP